MTQIHSEKAPDINEARARSVAFSDNVALIPAIGDFFDRPLWTNCRSSGQVMVRRGQWVDEGEMIACFDIRTSAHRGFWLSLLIEMFSNPTTVRIYSPVAGLVLDTGGVFHGQQWIDSTTGLYGRNYMMAVLLPEHGTVPETCKRGFMEFCDFCVEHRQAIFHNHNLIAESGRAKVMEIWSESNIHEAVSALRSAPVIVRPREFKK